MNHRREEGVMAYRRQTVSLGLALMILAGFLAGTPQWRTIKGPDDLPEEFCTIWKEGDHLITFGRHLVVLGGTARPMYNVLNYPLGNAVGCLLSVAPSGEGVRSDVCLGSPNLMIRAKTRPMIYTEVRPATGTGGGASEARAACFEISTNSSRLKSRYSNRQRSWRSPF